MPRPARFRNAQSLSAREMNVLLTWATGGTPFGNPDKTPQPVDARTSLGAGDTRSRAPTADASSRWQPNKQEDIVEFVVPTGFTERRWLRAVDLAPGTPAIVRSATVQIRSAIRPMPRDRSAPSAAGPVASRATIRSRERRRGVRGARPGGTAGSGALQEDLAVRAQGIARSEHARPLLREG